jgi:hypothetical protein
MIKPANAEHMLRIEDWLLLVLRFAITRNQSDCVAALAAAADMNRLGGASRLPDFTFFTKASRELCDAIVEDDSPERTAALSRYMGKIENKRLRRAFEAALEIERPVIKTDKPRDRRRHDLWRGLPIRQ